MLVVKKEQMEQMEPIVLEPFLQKITNVVLESCRESTQNMKKEEVHNQVKAEYAASKHFGIKTERGITRFICLTFILGKQFYTQKDFIPLFNPRNKKIDSDIDLLFHELNNRLKK